MLVPGNLARDEDGEDKTDEERRDPAMEGLTDGRPFSTSVTA